MLKNDKVVEMEYFLLLYHITMSVNKQKINPFVLISHFNL